MLKCNRCAGTSFKLSEGFFFCTECGTQTQEQQEFDIEFFTGTQERTFTTIKIKKEKKTKHLGDDNVALTTWEEYNYVLVGLVNELINLGAKPAIKLTCLQLWTAYLRKIEVAFFSKDSPALPRLGAIYKKKDAALLFNRKVVKIKEKSNATEPEAKKTYEFKIKPKVSLAAAEYEAYKDDDDNVSLYKETKTAPQLNPLPVSFSKSAKKIFKKKNLPNLPSDELDVTETLVKKTSKFHRMNPPALGAVTRNIMFAIIYIALNQNEDDIQLSDLLRYIREGHVSYFQVKHFFPEDLQAQCDEINNMFKRSERNAPSCYEIRRQTSLICRAIRVKSMPLPNMKKLVKRYLEELCLPTQLYTMIERLLELCPPEMKYSINHQLGILTPNFEGRACAYILFVLKLLFGLDDSREHQISDACATVNTQISSKTKMFVWSDWVEYIELRKMILARCHYPSNIIYSTGTENSARLFLDFYENLVDKHQVQTKPPTKGKKRMENIRYVFGKLWEAHADEPPANNDPAPMKFEHSLTPASTYFEEILRNETGSSLFIPPSMKIDHTKRDINRLLSPETFQNECRQQYIELNIQPAQNNTNVEFEQHHKPELARACSDNCKHFYQYDTDIEEDDWLEEIDVRHVRKEMDRQRDSRMILKDIVLRSTLEQEQLKEIGNVTVAFYEEKVDEKFETLHKNHQTPAETSSSAKPVKHRPPKSSKHTKSITLITPNYDYWILMANWSKMCYTEFRKIENKLPRNFQWLLKECAIMLDMETKDLYQELLVLEVHFNYVYQPTEKTTNFILDHCKGEIKRDLIRRIKFFRERW